MPPTGDVAGNPSMCPDWESNHQPFGLQVSTQSTETHQLGLDFFFFLSFLFFKTDFRGGEREKHRCIHWLILICSLTRDGTWNLGILGQCSNQLSYLARAWIAFLVLLLSLIYVSQFYLFSLFWVVTLCCLLIFCNFCLFLVHLYKVVAKSL